jgi:hypothetical protein
MAMEPIPLWINFLSVGSALVITFVLAALS